MTIDLWPAGRMPGTAVQLPEGERPSTGDGVVRLTNVSRPQITVFKPIAAKSPTPAIIVCPGGGYEILAYNKEGGEIANWLASIGITGLLLKYRVPANRDGAFFDIQRAIRLVRHNASAWGIDPQCVGAMGFSAGAHLSARLSTNPTLVATYPHLDAADQLSDRPDFAVLVYPAYLGEDGRPAAELPLTASVPPTFIAQAEDDHKYISGTRTYAAAMKAAGASVEFKAYTSGGHGHGLRSTGTAAVWPKDCETWLRAQEILR